MASTIKPTAGPTPAYAAPGASGTGANQGGTSIVDILGSGGSSPSATVPPDSVNVSSSSQPSIDGVDPTPPAGQAATNPDGSPMTDVDGNAIQTTASGTPFVVGGDGLATVVGQDGNPVGINNRPVYLDNQGRPFQLAAGKPVLIDEQTGQPIPSASGGKTTNPSTSPTPRPTSNGATPPTSTQAPVRPTPGPSPAAAPPTGGAPTDMGDTAAAAAMRNYLVMKSGNASEPLAGGGFLDGTAEALVPFYLHHEKNQIRQQYANIAMQVAMQTIDPTDPQAKQKIDALYAYEMKQANQQIASLPLPAAKRAVVGAVVDGAEAAKSGTFHVVGGGFNILGGGINAVGGLFSGIGSWFNNNA